MIHDVIVFVVGLVIGAGLGAWAWNKYKAKVAADLVKIVPKV